MANLKWWYPDDVNTPKAVIKFKVPSKHCVFCIHQEHIFWDIEHGPYAYGCRLNGTEIGPCANFERLESR